MLPLSGNTSLTIIGREVALGSGIADLIAVEPSGRIAVIEIKLARNAEARRAVIAQVLTYAAYLRGMAVATFEQQVLAYHLSQRGHTSVSAVVEAADQFGAFSPDLFASGLAESLRHGAFRLVIVIDEAPDELVRLVGYLESVANLLIIDLITVVAYDVGGSQVLVPQRIDPERQDEPHGSNAGFGISAPEGQYLRGTAAFRVALQAQPPDQHDHLLRLADWADQLEHEQLASVSTWRYADGRVMLLPYFRGDDHGLVKIWLDWGGVMSVWRGVFESRAPQGLIELEALIAPTRVGKGNRIRPEAITAAVLDVLADAYREAAGR